MAIPAMAPPLRLWLGSAVGVGNVLVVEVGMDDEMPLLLGRVTRGVAREVVEALMVGVVYVRMVAFVKQFSHVSVPSAMTVVAQNP
jgi:hypothetical protein